MFQILHQSALKAFAPFQESQKSNGRPQELCPAVHYKRALPNIATRLHRHSASAPGATLLTLTSSSTLDRSRYLRSQISSGCIATRLHHHSASAPGATLLTLTSSSTLDRSRYLRSQINSGYIATRPQRQEPSCSP